MIKPEDVPESLVENYADRFSLAYWDGARGEHVAEFLNAAIEAGLVVPASEAKVLRRALENLAMILASPERGVEKTVELWIDQARKKLESET